MDSRIGTIIRDYKPVHYAYVNGHNAEPVYGSLEQIEVALGIEGIIASEEFTPRRVCYNTLRRYDVTLTWHEPAGRRFETIEVEARSHAKALENARVWKNLEYGRTRSVGLVPCTFKARLIQED